jgi:hypothetical protein
MTGNGMRDLPDAAELRLLIREVLRDALAAGYLKAPQPEARSTSAHQPRAVPASPPTEIPAGAIQQAGLPAGGAHASGHPPASSAAADSATRHVRLATDEDLHNFVLAVVRLADNPARRHDLLTGRLRFTLAGSPGGQGPGGQPRQGAFRIETGAVTERAVQAAAKAGERLVLGRRAVLTPLARDRALSLGVPIERER